MLTWLRKKQKSILKWTLILVIPSFIAFYGWSSITGADNTGQEPDAWWIRLKDKDGSSYKINRWEFSDAKDTLVNRYTGTLSAFGYGQQAPQVMRQLEGSIPTKRIAIEAIDNAILRMYARKHGFGVAPAEINQYVKSQFQGFTPEQARNYIQSQLRMTEGQFQAQAADRLLLEKVRRDISSPAFVSVYEIWQEYSLTNQQVKVAAIEINQSDFVDEIEIDENALAEYFKENLENYRIPERRTYKYIILKQSEISNTIELTDEELKTYYEDNKADFLIKKGAMVSQILLAVPFDADEDAIKLRQEEAGKIVQRLKVGADFAKLADEISEDPGNTQMAVPGTTETIKMGGVIPNWITEDTTQYGEEFIIAALALKQGEISPPIRTPRGWAILKANETRDERTPPFEEVKEEITETLKNAKAQKIFEERKSKLADAISQFSAFEDIVKATGLDSKETEPQEVDNYYFPNIGNLSSYENYFTDLLEGDTVFGIMDTPTFATFMQLEKIDASHLPELKDVREQVENDYKRNEALKLSEAKAKAIMEGVKSYEDLKSAADGLEKTLKETEDFIPLKDLKSATMPRIQDFASKVVRSPKGKAHVDEISGYMEDSVVGYAVWMVVDNQQPDKEEFQQNLEQLHAELLSIKRQTLLSEYLAERRAELSIEYNDNYLPGMVASSE